MQNSSKCTVSITKGKRSGQSCGRPISRKAKEEKICSQHRKMQKRQKQRSHNEAHNLVSDSPISLVQLASPPPLPTRAESAFDKYIREYYGYKEGEEDKPEPQIFHMDEVLEESPPVGEPEMEDEELLLKLHNLKKQIKQEKK